MLDVNVVKNTTTFYILNRLKQLHIPYNLFTVVILISTLHVMVAEFMPQPRLTVTLFKDSVDRYRLPVENPQRQSDETQRCVVCFRSEKINTNRSMDFNNLK